MPRTGRPRLPAAKKKKHQVFARLSDDEHELLTRYAAMNGLALGPALVRLAAASLAMVESKNRRTASAKVGRKRPDLSAAQKSPAAALRQAARKSSSTLEQLKTPGPAKAPRMRHTKHEEPAVTAADSSKKPIIKSGSI